MSEERKKILNMLAEGKISADEAESLLDAIGQPDSGSVNPDTEIEFEDRQGKKLKYLRVIVEPKNGGKDKVNIKIPLQIIRAGIKLKSVLPGSAKKKVNEALHEKGVNLDIDDIKPDSLDGILETLKDFSIDVDDNTEKVKIFVE